MSSGDIALPGPAGPGPQPHVMALGAVGGWCAASVRCGAPLKARPSAVSSGGKRAVAKQGESCPLKGRKAEGNPACLEVPPLLRQLRRVVEL